MASSQRHRRGGINFGRIFVIVIGIHAVGGLGVLFLAKTTAGQQIARTYDIKLFEPPKPPEQQKPPEPPKPPPPRQEAPKPAPEAPRTATATAPVAPPTGGGATIGGGGGGLSWNGGKFAGGIADGPQGTFHAALLGRMRGCLKEDPDQFAGPELEFVFDRSGRVKSFRLARSSGSASNDRVALDAAACLQGAGAVSLPEEKAYVVTLRLVPY
jgi:hypothetical protein